MSARHFVSALLSAVFVAACSGGSGGGADFRLIQFLESGKDNLPRNRILTFTFSAPVATAQDLGERLKIQNVQTGQGTSNFSRALGAYVVNGDRVSFVPQLPNRQDRGDAGFRTFGNYVVFLKGGPDGLVSTSNDRIGTQQEFAFRTNDLFEDPIPSQPPRALGLVARDATNGQTFDLARLDPRPTEQAILDSRELIARGRVIEPGAGGTFATPWEFELLISEPVDPATIHTGNVEMFEIFENATTSGDTDPPDAPAGHFGSSVQFKVPVTVKARQGLNAQGQVEVRIVVTPLFTLVDNTRYRLRFAGNILGIDFRKQFIGENGLTGDGQTVVAGGTPFTEPGGLGYTAEFLVRDRLAITSTRTLTYDPLVDGIDPELGQTTSDPARFNSALYNPASQPGTAVGFLSAFGQGTDGPLAVSGGATLFLDTGDTPNAATGNPFTVNDLDPGDVYNQNTLPGGPRTYDSRTPFEMQLQSLTISSGSTLRVIGKNPVLFRVQGITQIQGTLAADGGDGGIAGGATATGGTGGPGGGDGGTSVRPNQANNNIQSGCPSFSTFLSNWGGSTFPHSLHGEGPGRGYAGGEGAGYPSSGQTNFQTGTGGGGGSHAVRGQAGEDVVSAGAAPGSGGNCISGSTFAYQNSGVVGVRGQPGPAYGDPDVIDVLWGGSGGGAGGCTYNYSSFGTFQAGGGGGGGGGTVMIVSSGGILAGGGTIDTTGGSGGNGSVINWNNSSSNRVITGGGGGGAGGSIVLISGDDINLTSAVLDARGGQGGARAPVTGNCNTCNAGGAGGKGFIFLMDADGQVTGLIPGSPGTYPAFSTGFLTISDFNADRFSSIAAVTELFNVLAANPEYLPLAMTDVLANVSVNQTIEIFASSAKGDTDDPLLPDQSTEIAAVLVARVRFAAGSVTVDVFGNMDALNPGGAPARDAYVRIDARFDYGNAVEAALGPFASIDRMDIGYSFNG